jgi:hypothetical protein
MIMRMPMPVRNSMEHRGQAKQQWDGLRKGIVRYGEWYMGNEEAYSAHVDYESDSNIDDNSIFVKPNESIDIEVKSNDGFSLLDTSQKVKPGLMTVFPAKVV